MIGILQGSQTSGTEYDAFCKENNDLASATKVDIVAGRDIIFLSLCDAPEYQEPNATVFWLINDEGLRNFRKYSKKLSRAILEDNKYPSILISEIRQTTGLMCLIGDEKYIISQHAMATLTQQASVTGTLTMQRSNLLRDMHLADCIFYKNDNLTIVYREIEFAGEKVRKIYAVFAGAYREIPQTVVQDIANNVMDDPVMGEAKVKNWSIDHCITRLNLVYPSIEEKYTEKFSVKNVIPGIIVQTSDIGDSTICVYGTQQVGRSYVITEEVSAKHTKKNEDISEIIQKVNEKIFYEHKRFPELLAALIGKEAVDFSKPHAYDNLCNLVEDVTLSLLKGVLSKRQLLSLIDELKLEFSMGTTYTLYDVAITLMELPERIKGIDDSLMINVRKALSKAPEEVSKSCEIVLTA